MNSGLAVLELIARIEGVHLDIQSIIRDYSLDSFSLDPLTFARIAKSEGFKIKIKYIPLMKFLVKYQLPAVLVLKSGEYGLLLKVDLGKGVGLIILPKRSKHILSMKLSILEKDVEILMPIKHKKSKTRINFSFLWFLTEIKNYKTILAEVFLASFVVQIFGLATPLFTQVILDKVLVHRTMSTLNVIAVIFFITVIFEFMLNISRRYVFTHTTSKLDAKLGAKTFKHLLALPVSYFENRRVGDIIARVKELDNIRNFLTDRVMSIFIDLLFSFVFLFVMFLYSLKLTLIVLGFTLSIAFIFFVITPEFKRRLDERFYTGAMSNSYLVESLTGIQTVKSLAIEGRIQKKWESVLADYIKAGFNLSIVSNISRGVSDFTRRIMTIVILFFGVKEVLLGHMTVGQLVAFQMFSGQLIAPVIRLVSIWHEFQHTLLSVDRLGDILNHPIEGEQEKKVIISHLEGKITFEKVSFRYVSGAPFVLRNVSFKIKPGTCVGLVGRSGSGKSTIAKLIQGLYTPTEGRVLIDDIDIKHLNLAWLRKRIGVVLQQNFLFSGTIKENIAMPRPDAPLESIIKVAKLAGAHDFITKLPKGYDTILEERGENLSGGQKQRIAIARALITDPRILIFDEATSALDYESEQLIKRNMQYFKYGRTVVIIAHRLTTVRDCDFIVAFDNGEVVEVGSHNELLRRKGYYYKLFKENL